MPLTFLQALESAITDMGAEIVRIGSVLCNSMLKQRTLRNHVEVTGTGIHSGKPVRLTLGPAGIDQGLRLIRTDVQPHVEIPLQTDSVVDTRMSTSVGKDGVTVSTVEHLMSAFWGMGIDNATVQVEGDEIPIMDGSASQFIFLIESAGIQEQEAEKSFIRVRKPVEVRDEKSGAWAKVEPYDGMRITFTLSYEHPVLEKDSQPVSIDLSQDCYIREISRARTFGFASDLEALQANQKALGVSEHNAIALGEQEILNATALRFSNEFSRHKVLDALGDLYLAGKPLIGHFIGYKSGHTLNNELMRQLLQQEDAWELIRFHASQPQVGDVDSQKFWQSPFPKLRTA